MNGKKLVALVITLVLLVAVAKFLNKAPVSKTAASSKVIDLDLAAVEKFTVSYDTQSVSVARADGQWVVRNLWDYPADFDLITENVRKLGDLKGDPIRGGETQLDEFGLNPSNTDYIAVAFADGAGRELGKLELGGPRLSKDGGMGGYPNGQYVRSGGGAVMLVNEYLGGFPRRAEDWLAKQLLAVDRNQLSYIMVGIHGESPYGLLSTAGAEWTLSDLKSDEEMKQDAAVNVASALSRLELVTLADPFTALTNTSEFIAKTTNGIVYLISTGDAAPGTGGRYASISVTCEGADTNDLAIARSENEKFAERVFVLPDNVCQNLTKPRADLVQAKSTNAPANPPVQ